MSRASGFLCTLVALGSASLWLGGVRAQGGASPGPNSTQGLNNNAQYGLYSDLDPTMAIVVVVTVCAFFLMGFFSVYIRHCSEELDTGSHSAGRAAAGGGGNSRYLRRGLDPSVVDSFPVLAYVAVKDHKLVKGALECAVCLTEFEDFDLLKILPKCEHAFHPECIDAWLASHVTCPVCRANQTADPCLRHVAEAAADPSRMSQQHAEEEEEQQQQQQPPQRPPCDETRDEVRIDVGGGRDEESGATAMPEEGSRAAAGTLPKSHSTGHLPGRPGADPDRYALRLPEEVRKQIRTAAAASAKIVGGMKRSTSYDVLLAIEGSSWKGRRLLAVTPSFLSKATADEIFTEDRTDGGDREFEVGEQSLSRLPV